MVVPRTITKTIYTFQDMLDALAEKKIGSGAVEKARAYLAQLCTEGDWYEYDYDLWKKALDEIGFEEPEINFSGFWSQGDGASFTATVDIPKLVLFLGSEIEPRGCIDVVNEKEVFSAWVVHQIAGKTPVVKNYLKLAKLTGVAQIHVTRDLGPNYVHENTCTVNDDLDDPGDLISMTDDGVPLPSDRWVWQSHKPRTRKLWDGFVEDVETLRTDLCRAIYKGLEASYEGLTTDAALADFSESHNRVFDMLGHREVC